MEMEFPRKETRLNEIMKAGALIQQISVLTSDAKEAPYLHPRAGMRKDHGKTKPQANKAAV